MLPDTVTLYNFLGEENGVAKYTRTVIEHVKCVVIEGSNASGSSGNSEANSATLYIFDEGSVASGSWTLSDAGKDYFAIGVHNSDSPKDIPNRFRVSSVKHLQQGSRRMWHWEVKGT